MPRVSHFSGKTAATCCIQPGSSRKPKKTPERNCSTIAKAVTAVAAEVALPGRAETAIPRTVPASAPSAATHRNVTQCRRSAGIGTS